MLMQSRLVNRQFLFSVISVLFNDFYPLKLLISLEVLKFTIELFLLNKGVVIFVSKRISG